MKMNIILFLNALLITSNVFAAPPIPDIQDSKTNQYRDIENIQEAIKTQESRSSDGVFLMALSFLGDIAGLYVIQKNDSSNQSSGEAIIGISSCLSIYGGWEFVDSQIQINPMRDEQIKILLQVN